MYIIKPSECTPCPLFTTGLGYCPDLIVPDPEYTFYGEAPGKTEIEKGKPFVGKAGFVLKEWLLRSNPTLQMAYERNKISFKNILKCLPPLKAGKPYPSGKDQVEAETCCKQYRDDTKDARVVVLCGEHPQRHFFDAELTAEDRDDRFLGHDLKGVTGRIGRTYEKDGRRYVFCPHPAYILRQPALVSHGQRALEIAVGQSKELEPNYVSWEEAMKGLL